MSSPASQTNNSQQSSDSVPVSTPVSKEGIVIQEKGVPLDGQHHVATAATPSNTHVITVIAPPNREEHSSALVRYWEVTVWPILAIIAFLFLRKWIVKYLNIYVQRFEEDDKVESKLGNFERSTSKEQALKMQGELEGPAIAVTPIEEAQVPSLPAILNLPIGVSAALAEDLAIRKLQTELELSATRHVKLTKGTYTFDAILTNLKLKKAVIVEVLYTRSMPGDWLVKVIQKKNEIVRELERLDVEIVEGNIIIVLVVEQAIEANIYQEIQQRISYGPFHAEMRLYQMRDLMKDFGLVA